MCDKPWCTCEQYDAVAEEAMILETERDRYKATLVELAATACGTCQLDVDHLDNGACAGCVAKAALA